MRLFSVCEEEEAKKIFEGRLEQLGRWDPGDIYMTRGGLRGSKHTCVSDVSRETLL